MSLEALRDALTDPTTYPVAGTPELRETHISLVGLLGDRVYKLKKPLDLGFLDFSTLEKRRHMCEEEVRLNRRLAGDVYRGVVALVRTAEGLRLGADPDAGELVEWAVEMQRLDDADRLSESLDRVQADTLARLGRRIARFHDEARRGPEITAGGSFEAIASLARENFEQTRAHVGEVIGEAVWERCRIGTERLLAGLEPLMVLRAERDVPCETHGDLRLDHVYLSGDRFIVLDGIEFSARYRNGDPVGDIAFLAMELELAGRADLERAFVHAWIEASKDADAHTLMPFYVAYRAVVRAKVAGIRATQGSESARTTARRHWLLAASHLCGPRLRPALLAVGGLPGVGKSTLARGLAAAAGFTVIRSDEVRKELAGLSPEQDGSAAFGEGLYTPEWTERTYAACLDRARDALVAGERVIVDASFGADRHRRALLDLAHDLAVPFAFLHAECPAEVAETRIHTRTGDVSDADVSVHRRARERWEVASSEVERHRVPIDTSASPKATVGTGMAWLRGRGLVQVTPTDPPSADAARPAAEAAR